MKTYVFIGLLIAGVVALVIIFSPSRPGVTNYPPKNNTIVAFGDSLVFGVGSTRGNDFVSVLGAALDRPILNLGVSGDTTADGILRMDTVTGEDPGIVLLLLGGNDYLRRIPEEETRANLETLITTFQKKGAVVVLLGVRGGILRDGRGALYEDLGAQYGAVYVPDVLDGIFGAPDRMYDAIHPNDAGYAMIAARLVEVFKEYKL